MMMKNYKDLFRKHFDQHLDDTDAEAMYEAISIKRRRRRRGPRRKKRTMLVIIPLVVGLGFLINTVINNVQERRSEKTSIKASKLNNNEGKTQANVTQEPESPRAEAKVLEGEGRLVNTQQFQNKDLTKVSDESIGLSSETSSTRISSLQGGEDLNGIEGEVKSAESNDDNFKPVVIQREFKSASANENMLSAQSKEVAINERQNEVELIPNNVITDKKTTDRNIEFNSTQLKNEIDAASTQMQSPTDIALLSELNFALATNLRDIPSMSLNVNFLKPENIMASTKFKKGFSVHTGAAVGLFSNSYQYDDLGDEDYVAKRDGSESSLEAISGHLLVEYKFHNNFSVSSGIGYTRFNELFNWEGSFVEPRNGEHVTKVEQYPDGVENLVYSSGSYEALVNRQVKVYNKTDLIYVPVYLNVSKSVGDLNFSMFGGVKANIVVNEDGYILNKDLMDEPISESNASKFGVGLSGGVAMEYLIGKNMGLKLNATYTQVGKDQVGITVNYHLVDVGLALAYRF